MCLYDNYFRSFLTVPQDLTAISISRLMNRTYFNFKMKFAQNSGIEYLLEYPFVPSAKLHKITKYFNCETKI